MKAHIVDSWKGSEALVDGLYLDAHGNIG
jgi:hypothetical protein